MDPIVLGLGWYVVFLFSTTAHEAAHALIAWWGGDATAYDGGQVSLNPMPHIRREPFGMVIMPLVFVVLIGFPLGFAHAPYNVAWAQRYPRRAAWMALAGPAANILIAMAAGLLLIIGFSAEWWEVPTQFNSANNVPYYQLASNAGGLLPLVILLSMLFTLNVLLAIFNLLPLPPLDGSGAVPLLLSDEQIPRYIAFIQQPYMMGVGLLGAWLLFPYVFRPAMQAAVDALWIVAS